ncbi:MAG: shikimate kinase [Muribaculaceae bacterium]|nr:shikimate kinase [Muribaculaceae bacterium]
MFLVGYMGCGKTTLGRAVARIADVDFIDLDHYIENRFRRSVRDIFAERGEDAFRIIERNMLREVGEFENVIVACGGGTPCFFNNMEYMNARGTTVFLNASMQRLHERLCKGRHKRPLIASFSDDRIAEYADAALRQRLPYYMQAAICFNSDELECRQEIDNSVEKFVTLLHLPLREHNA